MNRGLLLKTVYEAWPITMVFAAALAIVVGLLSYAIPTLFSQYSEQLLQLEFVQRIVSGLVGAELGERLSPAMLHSFVWVHPIVLSIIWAQEIAFCTRVPAGEIDRGTADFLFGLPVSRVRIYVSETVVWLGTGVVLLAAGAVGNQIGGVFLPSGFRGGSVWTAAILANVFSMYLAIGGMTLLVSAVSDRRGVAVGVAFGVVLASFLVNLLAQFWPAAERLAFLSVLNYVRPFQIVRDHAVPWGDMLLLAVVALVFWTMGAVLFTRRDIRTL